MKLDRNVYLDVLERMAQWKIARIYVRLRRCTKTEQRLGTQGEGAESRIDRSRSSRLDRPRGEGTL